MASAVSAFLALAPGIIRAHDAAHHDADPEERALLEIVGAERALGQALAARSPREAAARVLAPDAIVMTATAHAAGQRTHARVTREPAQMGLTRTYDLAYSTGAYTVRRENAAITHGLFLSVWRRHASEWRIALDTAVSTGAPIDFVHLGAAPRPSYAGKASTVSARAQVQHQEDLLRHAPSGARPSGTPSTPLLAPDVRLYRDGMPPLVGVQAVRDAWAGDPLAYGRPQSILVGNGADLAVTHGILESRDRTHPYVHVWLRDRAGAWHLAFEVIAGNSTLVED